MSKYFVTSSSRTSPAVLGSAQPHFAPFQLNTCSNTQFSPMRRFTDDLSKIEKEEHLYIMTKFRTERCPYLDTPEGCKYANKEDGKSFVWISISALMPAAQLFLLSRPLREAPLPHPARDEHGTLPPRALQDLLPQGRQGVQVQARGQLPVLPRVCSFPRRVHE